MNLGLIRYYYFLIFICAGVEASAQIRVEGEGFMFPGMIPETMFGVRDSLSWQSMPDVHIRVASRKDTVDIYTDEYGVATVPFAKFNKDSVEISVSFMGYRPLSLRTALDKPNLVVHVTMMEDPMEINAIIVKDNSVLMVSKGDTVVYNAVAVNTLEGDNLEQLLRKLPGITIENGSIKAGGRDVNKILINGTLLFGSNMSAALRLIESQMVEKVKVYDQHAQDRMIEADTLGQKDHVIDVITKEKLTKVQEMKLMAALGLYTEEDYQGRNDFIADANFSFDRYEEGKPNMSGAIGISRNSGMNQEYVGGIGLYSYVGVPVHMMRAATSPQEDAVAAYSVTGQKQFKNKYYSTIVATAGREQSYSSRMDTYNEIARRESSRSESEDMSIKVDYAGGYRFNVKDRNDILIDGKLSFSQNRNLSGSMDTTLFNADEYISRLLQDGRNRSFSSELHLFYIRMFENPERHLTLDVSLPFSLVRGSGSTVDTLKTTTYPQFMTRRNGSDSFTPKVRLQYSEPIVRYLSFDLSGTFDGEWSDKSLYSFDRLLMQEDRVNTYDYSQRRVTAGVDAALHYYNRNDLNILLGVNATSILQKIDERLYRAGNSKVYWHVAPRLEANIQKPLFNFRVTYSESPMCPSVEQLRNSLDYSNPLYLRAGNPDLKLSVHRMAGISASYLAMDISTTFEMGMHYGHTSNCTGNNTTYFSTATRLDDYGYDAVAGAQLVRPENIGSAWNASANMSASFRINPVRTSFRMNVNAMANESPFMVAGAVNMNATHALTAGIGITTGFSDAVEFDLWPSYTYGINMLNGGKVYAYSKTGGRASARSVIAKHVELAVRYDMDAMMTDSGVGGYFTDVLDFSAGYRFGKGSKYRVTLNVNDILDNGDVEKISVQDLFIRRSVDSVLGRNVMLGFEVTFK